MWKQFWISAVLVCCFVCCFFFSRRRRHTRYTGDWSSDVCSSDLLKIVLHDGDRSRVVAMAVSGEIDVGLGCFLRPVSGVRRTPLFRFSLMVIEPAARPASGPPRWLRWKDIVEWRLIGAPPHNPIQQLIDRNLQRFGRREPPDMVFDYFETQIAMG